MGRTNPSLNTENQPGGSHQEWGRTARELNGHGDETAPPSRAVVVVDPISGRHESVTMETEEESKN